MSRTVLKLQGLFLRSCIERTFISSHQHVLGSQFGIQTPPLLNYLQSILRGYSDGQILKELLQNAEDAGAREIQFLYDRHQYGTDQLLDPRLKVFQGPALCSFNDAVFKEEDWDAIQKPSQSGKKGNVLKVGRFGIGFSSVYHLTDLPCIISQNYLAMIDPFQKYFEDEDGMRQSGSKWKLSEVIHKKVYKHQFHPFREAFSNKRVLKGRVFPATFFRFPLRASPSKLCESVYTAEKTEELFAAFKEDARIVLLFLRKIEKVNIFRQESLTLGQKHYLEVSIEQSHLEELRNKRNTFDYNLQKIKMDPKTHCQNIAMTNRFNIVATSEEGQTVENWVVHQEIALKCNPKLRGLFKKLNFLPWIGVAVPLFRQESNSGRTFCFLPLPSGEASLSGLPVHVHGFFGVSDDRRSIKWPGGDQIQNEEAEWNKLLVDEVLPNVYLEALVKSTQVDDIDPTVVYSAFPDLRTNLGHWSTAAQSLYDRAFEHPLLYCQTKQKWMSLKEVVVVPNNHIQSPEQERLLVSILEAHGSSVVTDLPDHIQYVINDISTAQLISPSNMLKCLREGQQREFSDEDRLRLLDYLLVNECTAEDLEGLSLLPLESGGFSRFSANPDSVEMVYIPTESCQPELLPNMPHRFLRRNLEGDLAEQLHNMCSSEAWRQFNQLDVEAVLDMLPLALPELLKESEDEIITWQPAVTGTLDMEWLQCLWTFLRKEQIDLDKLLGLKVIPVSTGSGSSIGMAAVSHRSKVICRPHDSERTEDFEIIESVLAELGAVFCTLPDYAAVHYQMSSSEYVGHFTPKDILSLLQSIGQSKIERKCGTQIALREHMLSCLLPYLYGASFSKEAESFIKSLVIFPQFQNDKLLPLTDVSGMLNTETRKNLPNIRIPSVVCIYIDDDSLCLLLKKLEVPECTSDMLLERILCDASENKYSSAEMEILLNWILGQYENIRMKPCVRKNLQNINFIPNINEELRKPQELFDRSDDLVQRLAIDSEWLPNEDFFSTWDRILKDLGLKPIAELPSSQLIKIAENIRETGDTAQSSALVEFLVKFPQCLSDESLCEIVKQAPFLACRPEPPSAYPPNFPFWGKGNLLSKPVESFIYTDELAYLAGVSVPLVEDLPNEYVVERLGIRKAPMIDDIMKQLKMCVSEQVANTSLWTMLHCIYEFLNDEIGRDVGIKDTILRGLPGKWIYLGDRFVEVKRVYREETSSAIDLRPFRSALSVDLKEYGMLFSAAGVPDQIDKNTDLLIGVLEEIKDSHESPLTERVRVAMTILRRLVDMGELDNDGIRQRILVPTHGSPLLFLPPDQVCYCDAEWLMQGNGIDSLELDEDDDPVHFVHDDISPTFAEKLGVISLSERLAGANEIGGITQTGQFEPLTVRLRNILRDGYQPESIAKEMVQNAEDAGATSVKFLLDLRSNSESREKLLDPEMRKVQGPALWVYNDATFSEEDLQNITKLGGATKGGDGSKIGQFGLGFNAVYHITDVPSFVSTNVITFFDPHRFYLKRHIRGIGCGIQLNFLSNPSKMRRFRHQFEPYDGVFGCKLLGDDSMPEAYNGTLFRLPLRSQECAYTSQICEGSYNEENMKPLMKSLCETANQLLLFTEGVHTVSVHLMEDTTCIETMLYEVNRKCTEPIAYKQTVNLAMKNEKCLPQDTVSEIVLSSKWTKEGKEYFGLPNATRTTKEKWLRVSSAGRGVARVLCESEIGRKSGLLPCGGVAWSSTSKICGNVFCYLPLSVPNSGLPVCVNGGFAIASDRRGLWRDSNSFNSSDAEFRVNWNQTLFEDVIVSAYLTLLGQPQITNYAKKRKHGCFSLWPNPDSTSQNTDCGKVMTGFYRAVSNGMSGKEPPRVFFKGNSQLLPIETVVFLEDNINVETEMLRVFESIMTTVTGKTIFELPLWTRRGFEVSGSIDTLRKCTYSMERFFREIFLPNFRLLNSAEINAMMLFALDQHDTKVLEVIKNSECIPNDSTQGLIYKKPHDLLDPVIFKDIFFNGEGVFPAPSFLRDLGAHRRGTLREIGCMRKDVDWAALIDRAKTVQAVWNKDKRKAKSRSAAIVKFMDAKLDRCSLDTECQRTLGSIMFLSAERGEGGESLQCAKIVYSVEQKDLIGLVCYCLNSQLPASVSARLAISKRVVPEDVIRNLHELQACYRGIDPEVLHRQLVALYQYLQSNKDVERVGQFVRNEKWILVEDSFIAASRLARKSESIPPFLYKVPPELRGYRQLLKAADVKDNFDYEDFIGILDSLMTDLQGKPLDDDTFRNVLTKIIKPLYDNAGKIPNELVKRIPLPDTDRVLLASGSLSFCDLDKFAHLTTLYDICHREISSVHAKKLGVEDIRDQMLSKYSHNLPGWTGGIGESFGQKEKLVTRITRIMEGYPCDFSILKEIVQNADDAKATKVHFVIDCKERPVDRLFYDTMADLQGPALLAYNNSTFSEDDIKGIQKLGQGSKGDDTSKTGRYGVGFNVVYHLTDCPMFLTGGETLCIFDPTLKYVKDASETCPGRMYRPVDDEMLRSYGDIFDCFFSYKTTFSLGSGSLFRFPLRRTDSPLGPSKTVEEVQELFQEFKSEMFDTLLFLKNVREITLSTWKSTGNMPASTYTVTAEIPKRDDKIALEQFYQSLSDQKDIPLSDISLQKVQYPVKIRDSQGYSEDWLVHQRIGIRGKDAIPQSVHHANIRLKLVPKGGVAARLGSSRMRRASLRDRKFRGKCFCFLPLPNDTDIPIHVDGYFSLGHESRRSIWEAPHGDPRGDWNLLLAREVIAPAYVSVIDEIRVQISSDMQQDPSGRKSRDLLQKYHSFLPDFFPPQNAQLKTLEEICKSFYLQIVREKLPLFPVVLTGCPQFKLGQNGPLVSSKETFPLLWKSCISGSQEKGYFDNLRHQKDMDAERSKGMRKLLLKLGFPVLDTPLRIFHTLKKVAMECEDAAVLTVSPEIVLEYLKADAIETTMSTLPLRIQDTIIARVDQLHSLIDYTLRPETELAGLPLLLTNDAMLQMFRTSNPVFHSKYHGLLPARGDEFLHHEFVFKLNEQSDCFRRFGVVDFVERLPTYMPMDEFCNGSYTPWSPSLPTKDWLINLWEFLWESRLEQSSLDLTAIFGNWCIFPSVVGDEPFLVPMSLSKTVLSSRTSDYHEKVRNALVRLNAPVAHIEEMPPRLHDLINQCASDLDNVNDALKVFDRLIRVNNAPFDHLEGTDHASILRYISGKLDKLSKDECRIVERLPCFQTIHGEYVDLTKVSYAVAMSEIPESDRDKWVPLCQYILLRKESIPQNMREKLSIEDFSEIEVYRDFIMPHFGTFSLEGKWDHLSKIMKMVDTDETDHVVSTLRLERRPIIPLKDGTLKQGDYFHDDENPVYTEMSEDKYFPPKHPDQRKQTVWRRFLLKVGIQVDVTCTQFEEYLRKICQDSRSIQTREDVMVQYLSESHHLHRRDFLNRIKLIPFISAHKVSSDLCQLHSQSSNTKVALSAVSWQYERLVWSTQALLPARVQLGFCNTCKNTLVSDETKKPTVEQVLSHTKKLFQYLLPANTTATGPIPPSIRHESLLKKVINEIFGFLSEKCEKSQTCAPCSEEAKCCGNCRKVIHELEDQKIIPVGKGVFFKAKNLTKHLPEQENDKLFLFLRELPEFLMAHSELLYCMGLTRSPSFTQYASVLEVIAKYKDYNRNPPLQFAALQAMEGLLLCLSQETSSIGDISKLFLLTSKPEQPFMESTDIFYNDKPSFKERLGSFRYPQIEEVPFLQAQAKANIVKWFSKLGDLSPKLISSNVEETPLPFTRITDCNCPLSRQVRSVLSSPSFVVALKSILSHNNNTIKLNEYENIFATTFHVKCTPQIATKLRTIQGEDIEDSIRDVGVRFEREDDQVVGVYLSHDHKAVLIHDQISECFTSFFGSFTQDNRSVTIVLRSEIEEDILNNLEEFGIKAVGSFGRFRFPPLGSLIEDDVACLLEENFLFDFSPQEYVGYNQAHCTNAKFVYAQIVERVDNTPGEAISANLYKVRYIIDIGTKKEVDALWLYTFPRPNDSDSNSPASSSRSLEVYDGEPTRTEEDFSDLAKSKRDVSELIEALWREEPIVRNVGLRRLMRRWHPDKCKPEHKAFAEEMFKHIRRVISRLERGSPSGVDTDEDIHRWARQNKNNCSRYWRNHSRRFGGRGYRGSKKRGYYNPHSYSPRGFSHRTFYCPPSFRNDIREANMWRGQARVDLQTASVVVNETNSLRYYQWKSSLCFYAAEKSIRAAQLICGCKVGRKDDAIVEAAKQLKRHVDVMAEVQEMVQIVRRNSHYPDANSSSIPHDRFSSIQAQQVMTIAKNIMAKVDAYLDES